MAALVQPYPQQPSTIAMLQTRPSSAGGILQQGQNSHHPFVSGNPSHRNSFHGINGLQLHNYRGNTSMAPVMPFTFTSGTNMPGTAWAMSPHLQPGNRTSSAPSVPQSENKVMQQRGSRYPAPLSVSTTSSTSSSDRSGSKDDMQHVPGPTTARVAATRAFRPQSTVGLGTASPTLAPPALAAVAAAKPSPDRYRRPGNNRRTESTASQASTAAHASTASMPNVVNFYGAALQQQAKTEAYEQSATAAVDSAASTSRPVSRDQAAKRYRRRSMNPADAVGDVDGSQASSESGMNAAPAPVDPLRSSPVLSIRPATAHGRTGSTESFHSQQSVSNSRPGSAKRESSLTRSASPSSQFASTFTATTADPISKSDGPRLVNIPPRGSSDAAKRNPSPLSRPATMGTSEQLPSSRGQFAATVSAAAAQQTPNKPTYAQVANGASPAAQHLAALSGKADGKRTKTSKLRRAFSFGSSAELRRASAENNAANHAAAAKAVENVNTKVEAPGSVELDEHEAEQARIAERQEAAGLGSGIYSGQGNFFTGSTDNLSISSTASSASVMIRKMGKGMKRSTRSFVGMFRPKSIVGVPPPDQHTGSEAQVSMVTVEAEREHINVQAHAHNDVAGAAGYPKLEINSVGTGRIDPQSANGDRLGSVSTESSATRQSIIGGEKERAEALATVKRGILKRAGTDSSNSSPVIRPMDGMRSPNFTLPPIPTATDSPHSSAPSTPNDSSDTHLHRRTGSVTLGGEDYFMSALRFRGSESKSMPATPQGGAMKRNATFSPRIQFHDTWPSGEYDRRGEIATCNRLTPMLAQQIKEELNTFKMEMEVHENSKIYTHFF